MFVRAGEPGTNRILVVCALTGEVLKTVFEADTEKGYVLMYRVDGNGKIEHGKTVELPGGGAVFPWLIERHVRPFDLVDRKTGEVIAEGR